MRISLLGFILFILLSPASAQSWRWGQRAGSATIVGSSYLETVKDMATDKNGNIYIIGHVESNGINIAGQPKTGFGMIDVAVASFRCDGSLRWTKIIGSIYDDGPMNLRTDKLDGVYISVSIFRDNTFNPVHIDNDLTITSADTKSWYLIKYDTSGNLKWIKAPQADTVSPNLSTGTIDMDVDSAGNLYCLSILPPGLYNGTGGLVSTVAPWGDYMLNYDKNGNFTGGFKWDTQTALGDHMTRDPRTGKVYLAGETGNSPLPMGSTASIAAHCGFVACFDKNGKYLWDIQSNAGAPAGRVIVDASENIYLGGSILSPSASNPNANFNGFVALNPKEDGSPFIIKIKPDRTNDWATYAQVEAATFITGVAERNSGEIVLMGDGGKVVKWVGYDKDSLNMPGNMGYRPFMTRFNTQTGKILGMEQLPADGTMGSLIIADGRNNVFIGGYMNDQITVNSTTISSVGGETDWFVAKYGQPDCGCANVPEPRFTFNKTSNTDVSYTYTGTAYSTIEWDFDDGNTSTQPNPTHTYADTNWRHACVKVTNACGDNTYCAYIPMWPDGISTAIKNDDIKIYPNPVSGQLIIEGMGNDTKIIITDVMGRVLYTTTATSNKTIINTEQLQVGVYIVQLIDHTGNKIVRNIVKQ